MPVYKVPPNPFLSAANISQTSAMDLMPTPFAAARQPLTFMTRKLLGTADELKRADEAVNNLAMLAERHGDQLSPMSYDNLIDNINQRAARAKQAYDAWEWRNINAWYRK